MATAWSHASTRAPVTHWPSLSASAPSPHSIGEVVALLSSS
jgi:hypothetical protein